MLAVTLSPSRWESHRFAGSPDSPDGEEEPVCGLVNKHSSWICPKHPHFRKSMGRPGLQCDFLLLLGGKRGGKCFLLTSAVPNLTNLSSQCPLLPTRRWDRERNALLQTRWEHSTWPNQSITLVGRRCATAVQQHTISQSIGHKHMVTNQWPPWGRMLLPYPIGSWLMTS